MERSEGAPAGFNQVLTRFWEEGYLERVKHIREIEVYNKAGDITGYRGQRISPKKGVAASETLKVIYTVKKDRELQLIISGQSNIVSENEQIEILSTELNMHNTAFIIVRPGHSRRSGAHRESHRFAKQDMIIPRDFT